MVSPLTPASCPISSSLRNLAEIFGEVKSVRAPCRLMACDEVENSPVMEKLWAAYQKNFSYASDLHWHTVMDSVRSLYELAQVK